ncbi:MAG TPA: SBBP repeat-containing protein, partial [Chitinophagales bacterium]|nr:SBBP repeat-containing protein [Chitinophagales bacterium]
MKYLFSSLLVISFFFSQAQVNTLWTNSQTGTGDNSDRYNAIVSDASGNLFLSGYTFNTVQDKDYLVVKMNSSGDTLWTRQFNGISNGADKILYMAIDGSGNVYVTGQSDGGSIQQNDIVTRAYDGSGNLLWSATYNNTPSNQDDQPNGIAVDNSGNVFVTGETDRDSTSTLNDDILTIKYNSSGVQQWAAKVNGTGNGTDRGNGVVADNAGGCVITGRTATTADDDVITIKYSSSGTETWRTVYNRGFGNDRGEDIFIDGTGNLYVTGRSKNSSDYDVMTIKYNSSGAAQWTKFYNGGNDDYGSFLKADASGNVYVTGQTNLGTNYDIVTLKYNSTGTQQWVQTFGNAALNDEDPSAILFDGAGNVYVTGKSDVNAAAAITADNFITLKYNSSGILQWSVYFDGTATNSDDIAEGMVLDATATNLYVCGGSQNLTTQDDATLIKYATSSGTAAWTKNYNGKGDFTDKVQAIITDAKNNVYVTGYVMNHAVRRDLFVAKMNSAGVLKWFYTYDFSQQDDEGKAITLDTSGHVYVCGNSIGNGTSDDYITIKLDTLGVLQWTARYNYIGEADVATSIAVNPANGNVFVTGYCDANVSSFVSNYDIATVKYSSAGSQSAVVRYNGTGNGVDKGVKIVLKAGNEYVTGRTWSGTNYDIVTIKYGATLTQQWLTKYSGVAAKDDEPRDMYFDGTNLYVTGNTGTVSNGDDYVTIKYNGSGVQQWASTYNGTGSYTDRSYGVISTASGVFITGRSAPTSGADSADIVTIKYSLSSGVQDWLNRYNGPASLVDRGNAIAVDKFGNIYATGESVGSGSGSDYATIVYDVAGRRKWVVRSNGAGNGEDVPRVMAADALGYIYVAGYTKGSGTAGFDATTIKYCPIPAANAGSDVGVCSGKSTTLKATGGSTYTWSPATGLSCTNCASPKATPTVSTSYVVTVDNGLGCGTAKDTVIVTLNPAATATTTADGPLSFCAGDSVILTANSCTCTYKWKVGSSYIAGATNISYTAKAAGTYKVVVTNSYGCSKTSTGKTVQIVCKSGESSLAGQDYFNVIASPNPTPNLFSIQLQS